jgi:hypothetical protein
MEKKLKKGKMDANCLWYGRQSKGALRACTDYNSAVVGADLSDQYTVTNGTTRKTTKKYFQNIF